MVLKDNFQGLEVRTEILNEDSSTKSAHKLE